MKILANEVKKGMEVKFGWSQWLLVKEIKKDFQKNGKELTIFIGDSEESKWNGRGRRYATREALKGHSEVFKSLTKVDVR